MGLARSESLFAYPTDYEDDAAARAFEQTELLCLKRVSELELADLVGDVESMGREQRHAPLLSCRVLISPLLKRRFQPSRRSRSWKSSTARERRNTEDRERDDPSLEAVANRIVAQACRTARRQAAAQTDRASASFPADCPWTPAELLDPDFQPE